MITYGHEQYIKEAIEGVLMQETDLKIELIIADDNSPDNTEKIVKEIQNKHPKGHFIQYTKHKKNKGIIPNFVWALEQCKGKYIALCDGDDYWTDPLKLQKQVDFLEANEDYGICFHKVAVFNQAENKLETDRITRSVSETTTISELSKGNFMHTPSVVLRNDFEIPKWFAKSPIGDWTLYMIAIKDEKIKKIDEVMAVYRVHGQGIWSLKSQEKRDESTKETVRIVYKYHNKKLSKSTKKILKSRLGISEPSYKSFFKKVYKKCFNGF
jgi:glycosyltransferase involved in cell wall biosynthesis